MHLEDGDEAAFIEEQGFVEVVKNNRTCEELMLHQIGGEYPTVIEIKRMKKAKS